MRTTWSFHSANGLVFGLGAVRQTGDVVRRLDLRRTFIVTDQNLRNAGVLDAVHSSLADAGVMCEAFLGGGPEPSLHLVNRALAVARHYNPDSVIGVGGGSNMDVAKFVALLLRHPGPPEDFLGDDRIPGPTMPIICVPTTAGTGSEVTGAASFTDTDRQVKVGSLSNFLRPAAAIIDPELTMSCPPRVTAGSGIDALTHAIEAYTAVDFEAFPLPPNERSVYQGRNAMSSLFAAEAIRLVGQHLRQAVTHGRDLEARSGMMLAATLAGLAFSNSGVGIVHALEYPVGGATNCAHGEGNGLLLPHVMRWLLPYRKHEFAQIAEWLAGDELDSSPENAVVAVEKLQQQIGIPHRLRSLGIVDSQIPEMAAKALALQRMLRVSPHRVSQSDLESIYRAAL